MHNSTIASSRRLVEVCNLERGTMARFSTIFAYSIRDPISAMTKPFTIISEAYRVVEQAFDRSATLGIISSTDSALLDSLRLDPPGVSTTNFSIVFDGDVLHVACRLIGCKLTS